MSVVITPVPSEKRRSEPRGCPGERKLYLPYSLHRTTMLPHFQRTQSVAVHWFIVDRPGSDFACDKMIQGYEKLDGEGKERAELLVNEMFREDEFRQLRDYLRERYHEDLRTSMVMVPVPAVKADTGTRLGTMRPFAPLEAEEYEEVCVIRLAEEPGYSLPFTVWGAYITGTRPTLQ